MLKANSLYLFCESVRLGGAAWPEPCWPRRGSWMGLARLQRLVGWQSPSEAVGEPALPSRASALNCIAPAALGPLGHEAVRGGARTLSLEMGRSD